VIVESRRTQERKGTRRKGVKIGSRRWRGMMASEESRASHIGIEVEERARKEAMATEG